MTLAVALKLAVQALSRETNGVSGRSRGAAGGRRAGPDAAAAAQIRADRGQAADRSSPEAQGLGRGGRRERGGRRGGESGQDSARVVPRPAGVDTCGCGAPGRFGLGHRCAPACPAPAAASAVRRCGGRVLPWSRVPPVRRGGTSVRGECPSSSQECWHALSARTPRRGSRTVGELGPLPRRA